ncbi:hypothetical protein BGZ49_004876 [Haplosporangium sp. Z 27]|nr:hypothetical protein BGZ49_004876 [Haplosporangium sp. Z 27]
MDHLSPRPTNGVRSSLTSTSSPGSPESNMTMTPTPTTNKKPTVLRNLQPRAAAAINFSDNLDSDEEYGGLLSQDYKAQRKTTKDLVDFLNSGPPEPPPGANMSQQVRKSNGTTGDEDKKKRTFLQKFRSKKSSPNPSNNSNISSSGSKSSSMLLNGTSSNISNVSGITMGKGKNIEDVTTATLPNGKKYIMIAVDYNETETGAINGGSGGAGSSGASNLSIAAAASRRQSKVPDESDGTFSLGTISKRASTMNSLLDDGNGDSGRRSTTFNSGTSEASKLEVDTGGSLMESLPLDTSSYLSQGAGIGGTSGDLQQGENSSIGGIPRNESKCASKVTFCTPRVASAALDEATVSEALAQRIASHKAKQTQSGSSSALVSTSIQDFPEITLPRPVSRKKVRHVQIQTQHSIMRPMYTQTEPYESLVQDLSVKEWSTQTTSTESVSEMGACTSDSSDVAVQATTTTSPPSSVSSKKDASSGTMSIGSADTKAAGLAASFTQSAAATTATTTTFTTSRSAISSPTASTTSTSFSISTTTQSSNDTTTTVTSVGIGTETMTDTGISPQDELAQLRQQNVLLQSQVTSLQRDLAAEMRARARATVAIQDTRIKYEMLSEKAFEKLKEMIFHRQILDKEMQELRSQVDMQSEANVIQQGEMLFRQEQMQMQMQMQQQQ